ncbi:hypothetical protein E2562_030390 [Oryza meyeriana var. granulata]|uniref:Uncharacterized protein n=1 Tax=Oryza meyeriana var. granulata TaxID=110450 RepID=A0A6G1FE67_9ORYZ|nr:hypothetical protein E2562_030390 [Oryza meyeriana var. granulata]
MDRKKAAVPLMCHSHSRPVVDLFCIPVTPDECFLTSAIKGIIVGSDMGVLYFIAGQIHAVWLCVGFQ